VGALFEIVFKGRLLVHDRIILISNNRCIVPYPVFPLGLIHIAAALNQAAYNVKILDMLDPESDIEAVVKTFKPRYIGISQRNIDDLRISDCRMFAKDVISIVKRLRFMCDATVILGGSGYSLFPKELLELTGADFGVQGEGEQALLDLIRALSEKTDFSNIAGLVYRRGRAIAVNKKNTLLPQAIAPAFRPPRLAKWYLTQSSMLNIQTQRGCPLKCCYCTYPLIEGRKVRRRDYKDIAAELIEAKKRGCHYFFIVDSVFNTSASHVARFCEEIIAYKINVSWGCYIRPRGLSAKLTELMARAGCRHIEFGSDSFCDRVLEAYGKHFTFNDIHHSNELSRKAHIHCAHFLIIGGPGENKKSVLETFGNSKHLRKTVFFPFIGMRIYPGTVLHAIALHEGTLRKEEVLLQPRFYVAPHISREAIAALLYRFNRERPNWIVGEIPSPLVNIMNRLRAHGVAGPLWEFLAR
jgi:radical SAM superfamily enzyme YgiQ (UPF0313 family)